jgi:hypothetical protein
MQRRPPRYSIEEHARRGDDLYQQHIRPHVEAGNHGKSVAIDVDTGAFAVTEEFIHAPSSKSESVRGRSANDVTTGQQPKSAMDTDQMSV